MNSPVTVTEPDGTEWREVEVSDPEPRELVVVPDVRLSAPTPEALVGLATQMAKLLADIVNKQHLYQLISGKKYPQVEAWQTVARMDGVVAREVIGGVSRREDGSYEAHVEAIRLSDGAVIGRASAICGESDDGRWAKAKGFEKRSMAVTRATSRVFRQQYAWVMVLAGFQPTPADEMEREPGPPVKDVPAEGPKVPWSVGHKSIDGTLTISAGPPADGRMRTGPDGAVLSFRVESFDSATNRHRTQVIARGALADDINDACAGDLKALLQKPVTVEGELWQVPWDKDGKPMPAYARLELERLVTPDWTLPVPDLAGPLSVEDVVAAVDEP